MKERIILITGVIAVILASTLVSGDAQSSLEITVYNQNFGVVKDVRTIDLEEGLNTVMIQDVAKLIDPTSVSIRDLTGASYVLEQNYLFDLVNKEKIYEKYLGKDITVLDKEGNTLKGALLSYSGDELIIQNDSGVHIVKGEQVSLPELPEGLITKPTLKWLLDAEKAGAHDMQLSYMTSGLDWEAYYVAVVNSDDTELDLMSWVTLTNYSGASYKNARLKLIAGEVHRVQTQVTVAYAEEERGAAKAPDQFQEEAFFEYHMYTLDRKTDVLDNQQKQVTLFETQNISVKKEYVFDPGYTYGYQQNAGAVKVMLVFENTAENNMGMPLPAGIVRVYKKDSEGQLQFIGEDSIDHTPKDEKVRIYVGDAFDVVVEKKQTKYNQLGTRGAEISYEVSLRNHKTEDITVTVLDHFWGEWRITESSLDWKQEDAYSAVWYVAVAADGEVTLTYTVRMYW
ncbi:MAG: DUF4139 domain-containing protein [Theionarchaea archaeon]|nr:DUF4139 domain-containing protein [Theionarchaea archaeon]MBU7037339.1 DUF4139 domain-containing protein [Theionarchaea archaeon]